MIGGRKRGKSHSVKKNWKEGWFWNGFVFDVRGFGCVQNQVPNTYCKSGSVALN